MNPNKLHGISERTTKDLARILLGEGAHLSAVADAAMDAADPALPDEDRLLAIQRAIEINPTATVMMLTKMIEGLDSSLCEVTGDPTGTMIQEMRRGIKAQTVGKTGGELFGFGS